MSNATERYRQHLDQLYGWLRADESAIDQATAALLYYSTNCDDRRKVLKRLAAATERAKWCNDRIAEMIGAK